MTWTKDKPSRSGWYWYREPWLQRALVRSGYDAVTMYMGNAYEDATKSFKKALELVTA
jgi:hypothetical protein